MSSKDPLPACYNACMGIYRQFVIDFSGAPPYLEGRLAGSSKQAMVNMIKYFKSATRATEDVQVEEAFRFVFACWPHLSAHCQKMIALPDLERYLPEILSQIKKLRQNGIADTKDKRKSELRDLRK